MFANRGLALEELLLQVQVMGGRKTPVKALKSTAIAGFLPLSPEKIP